LEGRISSTCNPNAVNRDMYLTMHSDLIIANTGTVTPVSVENQAPGYHGLDARTMFEYAVDEVGVNFLPWSVYNRTDRAWTFNDALKIINEEKGRINNTLPFEYSKTCLNCQIALQRVFLNVSDSIILACIIFSRIK
jgi:hypothetical protein